MKKFLYIFLACLAAAGIINAIRIYYYDSIHDYYRMARMSNFSKITGKICYFFVSGIVYGVKKIFGR